MPKDGEPIPDFPLSYALTQLVSEETLDAMNACELGAHVRLLERAWRQRPSGTLPDDDDLLSRWAGLPAAAWPQARPLVLAGFTVEADGRLHHARSAQLRCTIDALGAKRSHAARSRWGKGGGLDPPTADASAMQVHSKCIPNAPPAPPHPPSASDPDPRAPAPQRPRGARAIQSAAEDAEVHLRLVGAGARAQIRDRREKEWVQQLLTRAAFAWAAADRKTFPPSVVLSVAAHRNAIPMRVAYAIEQIDAIGKKAVAAGTEPTDKKFPNPIGLLIAAVGAQAERPKPPWEVPLWFVAEWDRKADDRAKLQDTQDQIERLRSRAAWKGEQFYDENEAT